MQYQETYRCTIRVPWMVDEGMFHQSCGFFWPGRSNQARVNQARPDLWRIRETGVNEGVLEFKVVIRIGVRVLIQVLPIS